MDFKNKNEKKGGFRAKFGGLKFNFKPKNSEKPNEIVDDKIDSPDPEIQVQSQPEKDPIVESLLESSKEQQFSSNSAFNFEEFVDERELVSHDILGKKEMKIKVMEVSDEIAASQWKFGDRVKLNKILVTIKHLESQQVEEGEFDIIFEPLAFASCSSDIS